MHRLPRLIRSSHTRHRFLSTASGAPWHVAIVGSGPAAFYTADQLLKNDPDVRVDLFERLPVPFGLVRYGVAPDHQTVKNVTERFDQISSDPRCSLLCNVHVGAGAADRAASLPLRTLREHYNAVVLAYGADADRKLGLPGEDLRGVSAAREFVEWYNGHPLAASRADSFGLGTCETAVVIGHGNVALDCARMLCSTADQLRGETDVAEHAVQALADSAIRQVVLLGRRGVLQAAFTIKELRELSKREGATMALSAPPDAFGEAVMAEAAKERPRKRLVELMSTLHDPSLDADGALDLPPPPAPGVVAPRAIRVQFQRVPTAFVGGGGSGGTAGNDPGSLRAVRMVRSRLCGEPGPGQQAEPLPETEHELACGLALRAVGYKSSPMEGAPFAPARGVVPSTDGGRVEGDGSHAGLYVTGWLKRGPSGVILTNVGCAAETAAVLLTDRKAGKLQGAAAGGATAPGGGEAVRRHLEAHGGGAPILDYAAWQRIDALETERGRSAGKVREKLVSIDEMLEVGAR